MHRCGLGASAGLEVSWEGGVVVLKSSAKKSFIYGSIQMIPLVICVLLPKIGSKFKNKWMENSFPLHLANVTCGFLPCDMKVSALLAGYLQCLILCIFIHAYLIAKGHRFSLCPGHFHIALPLLTSVCTAVSDSRSTALPPSQPLTHRH